MKPWETNRPRRLLVPRQRELQTRKMRTWMTSKPGKLCQRLQGARVQQTTKMIWKRTPLRFVVDGVSHVAGDGGVAGSVAGLQRWLLFRKLRKKAPFQSVGGGRQSVGGSRQSGRSLQRRSWTHQLMRRTSRHEWGTCKRWRDIRTWGRYVEGV